jgi:hypothetical protein
MPTATRTLRGGGVTTISMTGPFFEKDPGATLRQNMRTMVAAMADEGVADVRAQIVSHAGEMPKYTGWTADHIIGRSESRTGKQWSLWAAVAMDTSGMDAKTAKRTQAAAATIANRWSPWRKTRNRLMRSRHINKAELLKGIA